MTKEGANARRATFLKCQPGLLKAASELYAFCAVEMAIIVLSPGGEPFYFGHPSVDVAVDMREHPKMASIDATRQAQTDRDQILKKLNKQYAYVLEQLKVGMKGAKELDDIKPLRIESLSFSELMIVDEWLEDVEKAVDLRSMDLLALEASSSTPCPRSTDASIRSEPTIDVMILVKQKLGTE
ncbi:agamous-like MADS-box protein AGL62 [Eucalyptus grandis]|uniref:agamous-like MADS-box protein AGL62 n=1 Tax=Eucalyptus grandis TaxID=71139 RepID=UPI0005257447|nr:agamous-like MADS-box protein AGL62 [Eucalyptus grandis]